ncbi:RNA polymerase sigma factor [Ekhidna sp.]|uniref:RNA polymerase sigma factor n=1 Tax=Ekhidna sp. TaxID=2608089 RepID=UPI003299BB4F
MRPTNDENICKEEVFLKIFEELSSDLYQFLYYKFGSANYPEDLVQEAFVKLWLNCKNVSPEKAKSFLFTIANNQMLNTLDKKKTILNYEKGNRPNNYTVENPEFILEEKEYLDKLQHAIESLPEDQRVTFLLNRVEKKKHKEIAEMLGISRKTVEKRLYSALATIRKKVGELK